MHDPPDPPDDRDAHREVGGSPLEVHATPRHPRSRLLPVLALAAVLAASLLAGCTSASTNPRVGETVPPLAGTTLEGTSFDLASLRGRPVIVNFWGPSCIPCREEFPLFIERLKAHTGDGLAIVGVLQDDPPGPALDFVRQYGATWPTIVDPDGTLKRTWLSVARPTSYFIDRNGVLRSIQIGEMLPVDFDRQFPAIVK